MAVSSDFSELTRLAADLGEVADDAGPNIRTAVVVTSLKVKKDWQEPLKGSRTLPALPYALGFDVTSDGHEIHSEIGFDKARNQGPLGNISEYGSPSITGRGFGIAAIEANQEDFVHGLDLATKALERKAGL